MGFEPKFRKETNLRTNKVVVEDWAGKEFVVLIILLHKRLEILLACLANLKANTCQFGKYFRIFNIYAKINMLRTKLKTD